MHQAQDFFGILTAILATAILASLLLHRFRQSILLGYFLCGILIGSGGFNLARNPQVVGMVSEAGVILLMFSLGIEFSITELKRIRRLALRGGGAQMALGTVALSLLGAMLGLPWGVAVLIGVIGAISSTAVALRVFEEGEYAGGSAGRLALGVAIFQDLFAVGLMLILPALAGEGAGGEIAMRLATAVAKSAGFFAVGYLLSRFVVPGILEAVEKTRSNELFTLCVLALCVGIAWLGGIFGLSLALGAFVAGLIVSETVYSHRILADILPFKHLYLALFFIGIGLQIDPAFLLANALPLVGVTLAILALKVIAGATGGFAAGFPTRPSIAAGLGLSSVGEFSLVLFLTALELKLIPGELSQALLACTTLSMGATPVLMKLATPLSRWIEARMPARARVVSPGGGGRRKLSEMEGHAIICGYGIIGESLNETLRKMGFETVIVELNAETVKKLVASNQPCVFADISHEETMRLVGVERARLLVITVPLLEAARAAIRAARSGNPRIQIICRARYPRHVLPLRELGVDTVVNEEAETLLEFTRRAMLYLDSTPEEIEEQLRQSRYSMGVEE